MNPQGMHNGQQSTYGGNANTNYGGNYNSGYGK